MEVRGQLQTRSLALFFLGGGRNQPKRLQGGLSTGMDQSTLLLFQTDAHNYKIIGILS